MTFKIFEITVPLGSTEENTLVKSLLKSRKKGDERKKKMQITKTEHGISIKRFQRDPINGPATASSVEHPFFLSRLSARLVSVHGHSLAVAAEFTVGAGTDGSGK